MNQLDFVGDLPPQRITTIRKPRPSVEEQKAGLRFDLDRLCATVPTAVRNGSVQLVREWKATQEKALKLSKNTRATVPELTAAISNMSRFS